MLRSSVREFLCSEAMHFLGVPTTRALSLVATGEPVVRDMFYDGRPDAEPGAIVCRVAPSFVRFGSFEIHATHGEIDILRRLADYVITTHYPELGAPSSATYLALFEEVCRRTAILAAHWTRVGFVHGVLNTDNMSILGLTIDYGPYGWLEGYDPTWTPEHDRRRHAPLSLRAAAQRRAVEPGATRRGAVAADRDARRPASRPRDLPRHLRHELRRHAARQARPRLDRHDGRGSAPGRHCSRCSRRPRPT